MKKLLILCLLFAALPGFAQTPTVNPGAIRRPTLTGTRAINSDAEGYLITTPKTGASTRIKVDPAISNLTGYQTVSGIRSSTVSSAASVKLLNVTDASSRGHWYLDAADTTTPDDSVTTLVTTSGLRYKLLLPDKRLTPDRFGVKGDSTTDDGANLQKWINKRGSYELFLPAGKYRSSVALVRYNKGAVSILGAGPGLTKIYFSGDTDGIRIENPISGNLGTVSLKWVELLSVGTKTGTKTALLITTQHEQKPGAKVDYVSIKALTASHQWAAGLHLHDCSGSSASNLDIQGTNYSTMVGYKVTNTSGRPSVEMSLSNSEIRAVKIAVQLIGTGSPAIEGHRLNTLNLVGCWRGVEATSTTYNAPDLNLVAVEAESFGGEAFYSDGFGQMTFANCLFYAHEDPATGITPTRAAYIKNTIFCSGNARFIVFDNSAAAIEFDGTSAGIDMDISGVVYSAQTSLIKVGAGCPHSIFSTARIWNGNTTWGSTQGITINDLSGTAKIKPAFSPVAATDGEFVRWDAATATYKPASRVASLGLRQFGVTSSQTVDPSLYDYFQIITGASNVTVTIDYAKLTTNQTLTFKRYPGSTGTITITLSNITGHSIEGADGVFATTFSLPATAGERQVTFFWNGANMELKSR